MSSINRNFKKLRSYSFLDATRKVVWFVWCRFKKLPRFFQQLRFYFYTKCWVENIYGSVYFNTICNNVIIGSDATIYPKTVFEFTENASLVIGNSFTLSYGAILAVRHSIKIGNYVMIGEYSSIRDTTHTYETSAIPYCKQPDKFEEIIIGDNVWIGRGCVILPGTVIENGVIVGAHSVVKGTLKSNCIYAGAPLKLIREINAESLAIAEQFTS